MTVPFFDLSKHIWGDFKPLLFIILKWKDRVWAWGQGAHSLLWFYQNGMWRRQGCSHFWVMLAFTLNNIVKLIPESRNQHVALRSDRPEVLSEKKLKWDLNIKNPLQ